MNSTTIEPVLSFNRMKVIKSSRSTGFFGVISLIMRAASLNTSLSSLGTRMDNVTGSTWGRVSTAIVLFGVSLNFVFFAGFQIGYGLLRFGRDSVVAIGCLRPEKGKDGKLIRFESKRLVLFAGNRWQI